MKTSSRNAGLLLAITAAFSPTSAFLPPTNKGDQLRSNNSRLLSKESSAIVSSSDARQLETSADWTTEFTFSGTLLDSYYGWSTDVSSDGNLVAVGGKGIGFFVAVKVFEHDGQGGWTQKGSDVNLPPLSISTGDPDLPQGDADELSLSGDGSTLVVSQFAFNNYEGRVFTFKYEGSDWIEKSTINGSGAHTRFGMALDLSYDGATLVVGAPYHSNEIGKVYVYNWDGASWIQDNGLSPLGTGTADRYGRRATISGDGETVAIYSKAEDNISALTLPGRVEVYNKVAPGSWVKTFSQIGVMNYASFGFGLSLSHDGSIIAIGSSNWGVSGSLQGRIETFEYDGTTWNPKGLQIDGNSGDRHGYSLDLSADGLSLAVGGHFAASSNGVVRIYRFDGTNWVLGPEFAGCNGCYAGRSVAISDDASVLAFGAPKSDGDKGFAQINRLSISTPNWACAAKLFSPNMAKEGVHPYTFDEANDILTLNIYVCDFMDHCHQGLYHGDNMCFGLCGASEPGLCPGGGIYCGGVGCDLRPGGDSECCWSIIAGNNFQCSWPSDTGCYIDNSIEIASEVRSADCLTAVDPNQGVAVSDTENGAGKCYDNSGVEQTCTNNDVDATGLHKNLPATVTVDPEIVTTGTLYAPIAGTNTGKISFCVHSELANDSNVYIQQKWDLLFDFGVNSVTFADLVTNVVHVYEIPFTYTPGESCPPVCSAIPGTIPGEDNGYNDPARYACNKECDGGGGGGGTIYLLVEADAQEPIADVTTAVDALNSSIVAVQNVQTVYGATIHGTRNVDLGELYTVAATAQEGEVNSRDREFTLNLAPDFPGVVQFKSFAQMTLTGYDVNDSPVGANYVQVLPISFFDSCVGQSTCDLSVFLNTAFFDGLVDTVKGAGSLTLEKKDGVRRLTSSAQDPVDRSLQLGQTNEGQTHVNFSVGIKGDNPRSSAPKSEEASTGAKAALAILSILCAGLIGGMVFMSKTSVWFGLPGKKNKEPGQPHSSKQAMKAARKMAEFEQTAMPCGNTSVVYGNGELLAKKFIK